MADNKKPAPEKRQTREQARAEYERKTKKVLFTKTFFAHQEAVMRDKTKTVGERVMACILRRSWGERCLYAIRDDGEAFYQRDICKLLKLDKKRVSDAVAFNQRRGYLEERPKLLYPVISPVLASPQPDDKKSGEFRTFLEQWKVSNSTDFHTLEVLRSDLKKLNKVLLADYKKWRKTRENAPVSLLDLQDSGRDRLAGGSLSPLEASNLRHEKAPAQPPVEEETQTKAQATDYLMREIGRMQRAYPNTPFAKPLIDPEDPGDVGLVHRILKEIGDEGYQTYSEQRLIGFTMHCLAQFKGWGMAGSRKAERSPDTASGPRGLGLLVNWARDYARIDRQTPRGQ